MIVFPMAGLSRRFSDAGYTLPKYMLPLDGAPVFDRAVAGFSGYFETLPFLFIVRDVMDTAAFVAQRCRDLGIASFEIVTLGGETAGQAETVALGIDGIDVAGETPLTIFNIDTFRAGFALPRRDWFATSAGYLEVFVGSGANWSYVRPSEAAPDVAVEVAEKRPISDLCCTGLYHFASAASFRDALAAERALAHDAELYVAPLYNHLIRSGQTVHYHQIDAADVVFCGIPAEYQALGGALP